MVFVDIIISQGCHHSPRERKQDSFIQWATRGQEKSNSCMHKQKLDAHAGWSLPPAMRVSFSGWLGPTALVFRGVSWLHSYPGIRGSSGGIWHSGSHWSRIIRLGIISGSRVPGGISATLVTAIASGRVGIGARVYVRRRHDGLRRGRIGDLRWRVGSLALSVGRVSGAVGSVVRSILGSTVGTLGVLHVGLCRCRTEGGRGWPLLLANLVNARGGIVGWDSVRRGV